ncbi:MAG: hypothetical protein A3C80_03930 [Candidatus Ryanbacteria bacterium RIFCSPHIGHO2_02_FULL_45_43]|uniref:Glycosyltransferase RgtA/B/C/D-like domain-containing protein n=1 Tax=Candidatus Ryanbacteria bacterium RIFCSPHIGHO2_01_45_13 TaxID=1802112 RepID=A0A1G2G0C1_9BACT|nr:MAG: hypothetical protein A2718_01350 [Candidatus Ryanbacteria bacterium RIFCSPHIGHO2_01_FULL_44_130]OGZ43547.1 MAG: hypothetical protein A2W41_04420 [Candidatus Ryanbacteria bacterium RIFCSPHIGHO2_01_45_13]OGZ47923.1 MAG: hypothetical protein A3C80_03930 [Candidatus Ryanbacteria bacterium RIFCSPHIGHO2_02_FULL_45_43]OGZ49937.1 MAG: hypothetical protein A3E55_03965 [Candidatus Ryanbacteria bacterium RIFCSPHIGHO2_12_FULL_44_20]OGZ51046.1 MAG: hypothetical protein A3A17_03505 [Candidatus Ryanba
MKKVYLMLAVTVAVGIFLRFWNLQHIPPGLYPDEAMNGNNALEMNEAAKGFPTFGWRVFFSENNGREGLYIDIVSLSIKFFGNDPFAIRTVSAVFGTITILGLFLFTRQVLWQRPHRNTIALIAAWLLATNFWHINFSRIGFRAIMAPFFLVWGLYVLYKVANGHYKNSASGSLLAAGGGIFFGLGFYSYIAYRIAPLLLAFPFISGLRYHKRLRVPTCFPCFFLLFLFSTFLTALPLGIYFINNPADFFGRTAQISIFSQEEPLRMLALNTIKTIGMFFWQGDFNWRHNYAGTPQLWWPVGLLFLIGVIRGFIVFISKEKKKERDVYLFLFAWIMLLLLPVITSAEGIPHALRAIAVIPAVMIIAALGLGLMIDLIEHWISKKITQADAQKKSLRLRKEFIILLLVFLSGTAVHAFNQYFQRWSIRPEVADAFAVKYAEIGKTLDSLPAAEEKYVIVNTPGHVLVRTIPMPAQTIMFLTQTFSADEQKKKNITYLLPDQLQNIRCLDHCTIALMEKDIHIANAIKEQFSGIAMQLTGNALVFRR